MAVKYICDGCGKESPAIAYPSTWCKPEKWFQRSDKDCIQDACSRECIDKISKKSGKTNLVLPI